MCPRRKKTKLQRSFRKLSNRPYSPSFYRKDPISYSRELRELKENESIENAQVTNALELAQERDHHYKCFIEDLGGHQLFESLFQEITVDGPEFITAKNG